MRASRRISSPGTIGRAGARPGAGWLATASAPLLVLGLLAVPPLVAGCGGAELELSAERLEICAGGFDSTTITARASSGGSAVPKGTGITFQTSAGSFEKVSVGGTATRSTNRGTDDDGLATVILYSQNVRDTATVKASFRDERTRETMAREITIVFGSPQPGCLPVSGKLGFTCEAVNVGALREPQPNIEVRCRVAAQTRAADTLPAEAMELRFLTEAGTVESVDEPSTKVRSFLFRPGGGRTPLDVDPDVSLDEPSREDSGRVRNPRDGLGTLLAVTRGEEAFVDSNGNGKYDPGEPFTDTQEPFVDSNDNLLRDPDEEYVDANRDGRFTLENGKWDSDTMIASSFRLLWTAEALEADDATRLSTPSGKWEIPKGGSIDVTLHLLDANLNPVAAFPENNDQVSWATSGYVNRQCPTSSKLEASRGFEVDSGDRLMPILSSSFRPPSYSCALAAGSSAKEGDAFSVQATAKMTPGRSGNRFLDADSKSYSKQGSIK